MFCLLVMYTDNHIYIRHIVLYDFEKGYKSAEAFGNNSELFSEEAADENHVRR